MKTVIEFLKELQRNNNRIWFEANRTRYREAAERFAAFVERLIIGIAGFDPFDPKPDSHRLHLPHLSGHPLLARQITIQNPHGGLYLSAREKDRAMRDTIFTSNLPESGFVGGHLLSAGLYRPFPEILRGVREEIRDNGQNFVEALAQASGFTLCHDNTLKKIPNGFPADSPYAEYFKLKDFFLERYVNERFMCMKEERLLARTLEQFRTAQPFNAFLNRAIDLVRSERE